MNRLVVICKECNSLGAVLQGENLQVRGDELGLVVNGSSNPISNEDSTYCCLSCKTVMGLVKKDQINLQSDSILTYSYKRHSKLQNRVTIFDELKQDSGDGVKEVVAMYAEENARLEEVKVSFKKAIQEMDEQWKKVKSRYGKSRGTQTEDENQ